MQNHSEGISCRPLRKLFRGCSPWRPSCSLSGKGSVSVELELPALALQGTIGSAWTHVSQQDLQQQPGPGALLLLLLLETGSSKPKAVRAWPPPGPRHSVQDLLPRWPPEEPRLSQRSPWWEQVPLGTASRPPRTSTVHSSQLSRVVLVVVFTHISVSTSWF